MSVYGRWDITVNNSFPSWVELRPDGGSFVGQFGSARPIAEVTANGEEVVWSLPKQYEGRDDDMRFHGSLDGDILKGTTTGDKGELLTWTAIRQAPLPYRDVVFGEGIELVQNSLDNWHPRSPEWDNRWSIKDEVLDNAGVGTDLVTNRAFQDFKLITEYRYPKGSNSGIYLRGRYEYQIYDDYDAQPSVGSSGAIYGFLIPASHAIKPFGEWNTAEITLVGRYVTVVLNGVTIHDRAEIPGITGGALDCDEGAPGPLFIQGDHGPVEYRRLTLYPAQ